MASPNVTHCPPSPATGNPSARHLRPRTPNRTIHNLINFLIITTHIKIKSAGSLLVLIPRIRPSQCPQIKDKQRRSPRRYAVNTRVRTTRGPPRHIPRTSTAALFPNLIKVAKFNTTETKRQANVFHHHVHSHPFRRRNTAKV